VNIYLISQNDVDGYDTYDSAVVIAKSEDAARNIHPGNGKPLSADTWGTWTTDPTKVRVELIGLAKPGSEQRVVCSSFNAG